MTQDLIKKMREEYAKQQEEKLIQEQVEQINLEANAAPTPSATNTPQAVLDRTVATIKKVNEVKASGNLQVRNFALTDDVKVNISTMDGTTVEKTLVAQDYVDNNLALLNASKAPLMPNIIDLTGKTQAEAYTALYGTGDNNISMFYTNPGNGYGFLGWVVTKTADKVIGSGIWTGRGVGQLTIKGFSISKVETTPLNDGNTWLTTPVVNEEFDITTKKYVDDGLKKFNDKNIVKGDGTEETFGTNVNIIASKDYVDVKLGKTLTLHWDDGTTTDIKVG